MKDASVLAPVAKPTEAVQLPGDVCVSSTLRHGLFGALSRYSTLARTTSLELVVTWMVAVEPTTNDSTRVMSGGVSSALLERYTVKPAPLNRCCVPRPSGSPSLETNWPGRNTSCDFLPFGVGSVFSASSAAGKMTLREVVSGSLTDWSTMILALT